MIRISVQGHVRDGRGWLDLARAVDGFGFDTLYVADHPGVLPSPFVLLAAASSTTQRIKLGTCVANAGLREPYALATEIATLNLLSGGRAVLGLGAGHTPQEWERLGRPLPPASVRISRLIELASVTTSLLAGETVSAESEFFHLRAASLHPSLVNRPVPLMIGGSGQRLLRFAAAAADIVGVAGLGKTLSDGHHHEVDWSDTALDRMFNAARSLPTRKGPMADVETLVQHVEITDQPLSAAERLADLIPGATAQDVLRSPFVWLGSPESIATGLVEYEERWGITRYVVRSRVLPAAVEVLHRL